MKKILLFLIVSILIVACKSEEKIDDVYKNYPKKLAEVLKAHGGLKTWNKMKTLSFNKGKEAHTIDLKTRHSLITHPNYLLGFNGKEYWKVKRDSVGFSGNPEFYHNLFFYFYAMPFVLADDGIVYSETEPLKVEGKSYPGIKISFNAGVGSSPDDNYFLYCDAETNKMQWLGYTVTFRFKKPSDKISYIRYEEWEDVNGLQLPKKLTWYGKDSTGALNKVINVQEFTLPLLTQATLGDRFYAKPTE